MANGKSGIRDVGIAIVSSIAILFDDIYRGILFVVSPNTNVLCHVRCSVL